jgi:hypothetical protein
MNQALKSLGYRNSSGSGVTLNVSISRGGSKSRYSESVCWCNSRITNNSHSGGRATNTRGHREGDTSRSGGRSLTIHGSLSACNSGHRCFSISKDT